MRYIFILSSLVLFFSCAQQKEKTFITEASCGQCQFGIKSQKGCDLAIKVDDKAYFVDGAKIDDFGDAHDEKIGLCNVIRKVEVAGKVENDRFIATSFKVVE